MPRGLARRRPKCATATWARAGTGARSPFPRIGRVGDSFCALGACTVPRRSGSTGSLPAPTWGTCRILSSTSRRMRLRASRAALWSWWTRNSDGMRTRFRVAWTSSTTSSPTGAGSGVTSRLNLDRRRGCRTCLSSRTRTRPAAFSRPRSRGIPAARTGPKSPSPAPMAPWLHPGSRTSPRTARSGSRWICRMRNSGLRKRPACTRRTLC